MSNRKNNRPIRVLHVIGGMNRAGAESMIMNIFRNIDHSRFQFDFLVYSEDKQDFENEIEYLGGRVIHTDLFKTKSPFRMVNTIYRVIRKNGPYDVIHCATLFNSAYPLIASLPFKSMRRITHSHNTMNVLSSSVFMKIYEKCAETVIRCLTDIPIACGKEAGDFLFGKKIFEKSGHVILNSVDIDRFAMPDKVKAAKLSEEYNLKGYKIITSVARFQQVKNHAFMLKIASCLKQENVKFKMLLVGTGELHSTIKNEIHERELDEEVILMGLRTDIPEILSVSDVFIMPSFFEGNPVSLIEAQIAGCHCVISDTITETIDIGLGLIKRVGLDCDSSVWAHKIEGISRTDIAYSDIARAVKISGYDLDETTRLMCRLYEYGK